MLNRLKQFGTTFSTLATWPALVIWWGWFGVVFLRQMGARLEHLSQAGMRVNDLPCASPLCDFSVFWQAGAMAAHGPAGGIYDASKFLALRQALFSLQADPLLWYYPPTALLPVLPLSRLPFELAFWAWTGALLALTAALLRLAGLSWQVIFLGLLSPAAVWSLELGQFDVVCGALLVAGLLASARRPGFSGVALGLLAVKPQSALLVPVALLAKFRWRALLAAFGTGVLLVLVSIMLLGWPVWPEYMSKGLAESKHMLDTLPLIPGSAPWGLSVFNMALSLGAGLRASGAAQSVAALAAVLLTWRAWRSEMGETDRIALCVFLSLLATPYGGVDYMIGYSVALAMLAQKRGWRIDFLDVIFWCWPALCPVVVAATGILFTPVIVALATWRTWQRAQHGAPAAASAPPGSAGPAGYVAGYGGLP